MKTIAHSVQSAKKLGGKASAHLPIHEFLNSSRLFFDHVKHRALLHHALGMDICIQILGDHVDIGEGKKVLIRDLAAEHLMQDFRGKVPLLGEWWERNEHLESFLEVVPQSDSQEVRAFIYAPYLQSKNRASSLITCSDFGVYLIEKKFGSAVSEYIAKQLPTHQKVSNWLPAFHFSKAWQFVSGS